MSERHHRPATNDERLQMARPSSSPSLNDDSPLPHSQPNAMDPAPLTATTAVITTIITLPLRLFLHRDIQPEGQRLILPFLTTKDRLRLSECSQGLLNYRYHLSRVRIRQHPSPDSAPDPRAGLDQLLLCQRHLEYLHVGYRSMLSVLDLASGGCFKRLKTLALPCLDSRDSVGHLTAALEGGGLEGLEELSLSGVHAPSQGDVFDAIVALLRDGACPHLRRLTLCGSYYAELHLLAEALESGHLHHLQHFTLRGNARAAGGVAAIARALQGGACPQLAKLQLSSCTISPADGHALGEAMRLGACPRLERLELGGEEGIGDMGFMAIFGALEAGGCQSLKDLDLDRCRLSAESANALGPALRSGHCHRLERLRLGRALNGRHASLVVIQAIREVGLPNLLHLHLFDSYMHHRNGQVLGAAIGARCLSKLEKLQLSRNRSLGDGGVVPIMAGLEGGGVHHLTFLSMVGVGMGPQEGQALARALASGHLSCLEGMMPGDNKMIGDHAMAEVIQGLRQCLHLRYMGPWATGMGVKSGEALLQGLRDGCWGKLEDWIDISSNPGLGNGVVGVGLAEVLGGEGGSKLSRLRHLSVEKSGLTQEGADRLLHVIEEGACPGLVSMTVDRFLLVSGRGWEERLKGRGVYLHSNS